MVTIPEIYTIVATGAMNPRIHHPSWYKAVGMLSEDEYEVAIGDKDIVCLPPLAQFKTGKFTVICQQERWEIQAFSRDLAERMLEIADRTFQALDHTPVNAFGFNFTFQRETKMPDVGEYLAQTVQGLFPGQVFTAPAISKLSIRSPGQTRSVIREIGSVEAAPTVVAVYHNMHYPITISGHFDLGPLLREHYYADLQEAVEYTNQVVSLLNKGKGE